MNYDEANKLITELRHELRTAQIDHGAQIDKLRDEVAAKADTIEVMDTTLARYYELEDKFVAADLRATDRLTASNTARDRAIRAISSMSQRLHDILDEVSPMTRLAIAAISRSTQDIMEEK